MNTMPERDIFERDIEVVIGGTSQTGTEQTRLLLEQGDTNVISTGSKETIYNFGAWDEKIVDDTTGLGLKDKQQINAAIGGVHSELNIEYSKRKRVNQHDEYGYKDVLSQKFIEGESGISDVSRDILTYGGDTKLTLHAMNMNGMSHRYPQEVVSALEESNARVASLLYISYEANSHVFYPVREVKQNMENSALEACENAKIIDLITFDSPSAKALGFTFLGIVGDFVNFLETQANTPISQKFSKLMKDFLDEDYQGIIDLFAQYPIRGELQEGQQSMKEMAGEGTLNAMISSAAKKINFAKISRVSGIITDLYLSLAMNDLNQNRKDILKSSGDRVLLDWDRISQQDTSFIDEKINGYFESLIDVTFPLNSLEGEINTIYIETESGEDFKNYELNIEHLDFLSNHFGIVPFFLMHDMIKDSGLLGEDGCILVGDPHSMIYSYNKIRMQRGTSRKGKSIIELINSDNPQEKFCVFEIGRKEEIKEPEGAIKYFNIPKTERDKDIDESSFPHSIKWGKTFLNAIPKDFDDIGFSQSSALIEHLGFQLANLLLNNPNDDYLADFSELFPLMKKFNKNKLEGKFGRIITMYEDPDLDKILSNGVIPEVNITVANYKEPKGKGMLNITLESYDGNGNIIAKHRFMLV